ncbi:MAG: hypothetical protein JXR76_10490 [Deltaproteobacteria bacterium]|nr:hypothetical protein [Deltaproteobacteria bacterium]
MFTWEKIPKRISTRFAKGVVTVTNTQIQPVQCNACGRLALAQLEGTPLCARCLFSRIDLRQFKDLRETISPLPLLSAGAEDSMVTTPA